MGENSFLCIKEIFKSGSDIPDLVADYMGLMNSFDVSVEDAAAQLNMKAFEAGYHGPRNVTAEELLPFADLIVECDTVRNRYISESNVCFACDMCKEFKNKYVLFEMRLIFKLFSCKPEAFKKCFPQDPEHRKKIRDNFMSYHDIICTDSSRYEPLYKDVYMVLCNVADKATGLNAALNTLPAEVFMEEWEKLRPDLQAVPEAEAIRKGMATRFRSFLANSHKDITFDKEQTRLKTFFAKPAKKESDSVVSDGDGPLKLPNGVTLDTSFVLPPNNAIVDADAKFKDSDLPFRTDAEKNIPEGPVAVSENADGSRTDESGEETDTLIEREEQSTSGRKEPDFRLFAYSQITKELYEESDLSKRDQTKVISMLGYSFLRCRCAAIEPVRVENTNVEGFFFVFDHEPTRYYFVSFENHPVIEAMRHFAQNDYLVLTTLLPTLLRAYLRCNFRLVYGRTVPMYTNVDIPDMVSSDAKARLDMLITKKKCVSAKHIPEHTYWYEAALGRSLFPDGSLRSFPCITVCNGLVNFTPCDTLKFDKDTWVLDIYVLKGPEGQAWSRAAIRLLGMFEKTGILKSNAASIAYIDIGNRLLSMYVKAAHFKTFCTVVVKHYMKILHMHTNIRPEILLDSRVMHANH